MKPGGQKARRAARRAQFHAARMRAAATPKDAAHAGLDAVRAVIADLPAADQDEAWKTLIRHFMKARQEITDRTSHNPSLKGE